MRIRTRLAAPAVILLLAFAAAAHAAKPPVSRPLSVLFLGDKGHHRPADRYAQIAPVLAGRGIDVVYTEKVAVVKGLKHPSPAVRRAAILALPRHSGVASGLWIADVFEDPEPQVRLAACLAMSEMPGTADGDGASRILSALLDPRNQQDRWMGDALTISAAAHAPEYFKALARRGPGGSEGRLLIPVTARVAEHYARGGPVASIASVLALQGDMKPAVHDALIGGLAKGWPHDRMPALDADAERAIAGLLPTLSPEARGQMLGLASSWGVKGIGEYVAGLARDFLAAASDASKPEAARIAAARQLIDLRKSDPQAAHDVIALVTAKAPPDLASGLIGAAARSDSPEVGPALVNGTTEDHELKNGVHFADVNGEQDVPGSKVAFKLGGQQVRYLTVTPKRKGSIASIELVKGPDRTAPIVLAATVEGFE